jgi:hypothetical protein
MVDIVAMLLKTFTLRFSGDFSHNTAKALTIPEKGRRGESMILRYIRNRFYFNL